MKKKITHHKQHHIKHTSSKKTHTWKIFWISISSYLTVLTLLTSAFLFSGATQSTVLGSAVGPTPKPTCTPRPHCLDTTPRCGILETKNMCPRSTPTPKVYGKGQLMLSFSNGQNYINMPFDTSTKILKEGHVMTTVEQSSYKWINSFDSGTYTINVTTSRYNVIFKCLTNCSQIMTANPHVPLNQYNYVVKIFPNKGVSLVLIFTNKPKITVTPKITPTPTLAERPTPKPTTGATPTVVTP